LITFIATAYTPLACHGEPLAGFPKGRSNPLVKGGVNAPPENASAPGGQRSLGHEFTYFPLLILCRQQSIIDTDAGLRRTVGKVKKQNSKNTSRQGPDTVLVIHEDGDRPSKHLPNYQERPSSIIKNGAHDWQSRGRQFDPGQLHQIQTLFSPGICAFS